MIIYSNSPFKQEPGELIQLPAGVPFPTEPRNLDCLSNVLALKIKVKVFNSWGISDQHKLMEQNRLIHFGKLKSLDNSEYCTKDKELHTELVKMKYQAIMYFQKDKAMILLLNDVNAEVLSVYNNNKQRTFYLN